MVNPQRSGVRSDTRVCLCGLLGLERSVLAIADRLRGDIRWRDTTGKPRLVLREFSRKKVLREGY